MPEVTFWCGNCGHRQDVPDRLIGRKVRCPKCDTKQVLRAPDGTGSAGTTTIMRTRTATIVRPSHRTPAPAVPAETDDQSFEDLELEPILKPSRPLAGTLGPNTLGASAPLDGHLSHTSDGNSLGTIRPATSLYTRKVAVSAGYDLSREIGRGGMGVVWSATQCALARTVAVKTLITGQETHNAAARFRAEAMVMAQIEHPNVMPVHDLITSPKGELQLVMKKIDGQAWRDLLYPSDEQQAKQALTMGLNEHLEVLLKVCDAIAFAHARSILHLDLKPANVMVGQFGEVLVLDWGCAVALRDLGAEIPQAAGYKGMAGTPAYMSPEMANQSGDIGPWSDIYCLAAILYELATGLPPHKADSVQASLSMAAANELRQPPPSRNGKPIPKDLVDIALQGLATDRTQRPPTVEEFAKLIRSQRHHAEALTVLESAKRHLHAAAKGGEEADDHYRMALAAGEQAANLWPGFRAAQELLAQVLYKYAEFALGSGAHGVAQAKARSAEEAATKLGLEPLARAARELFNEARQEESAARSRNRMMRLLAIGGGSAAIVGVVVLIVLMTRLGDQADKIERGRAAQQANSTSAERLQADLAKARTQLTSMQIERARNLIASRDLDGAAKACDVALEQNPGDPQATWLKACLQAGRQAYTDAIATLQPLTATGNLTTQATELTRLSNAAATAPSPKAETELGDFFVAQDLFALADGRRMTPEAQQRLYLAAFERFWAGSSRWMQTTGTGLTFVRQGPDGPANATLVTDLSPLRDLPLRELWLQDTRIGSIAALKEMPLTTLSLARTQVRDLSPLQGSNLEILDLSDTHISDLTPLTGMPLRQLSVARTKVSSLQPLLGRPLKDLDLSSTQVKDLAPLQYMKLDRLILEGLAIPDGGLRVLQQMPLTALSLRSTGMVDLTNLRGLRLRTLDLSGNSALQHLDALVGMPLEELDLSGNSNLSDLSALAQLPLKRLNLVGTRVTDLSPLAAMPLERLDLNPKTITIGLDALRAKRTLKAFGPEPVKPAAQFWREVAGP